jgi:hypothetical protein
MISRWFIDSPGFGDFVTVMFTGLVAVFMLPDIVCPIAAVS